jgi:hypothetical protein
VLLPGSLRAFALLWVLECFGGFILSFCWRLDRLLAFGLSWLVLGLGSLRFLLLEADLRGFVFLISFLFVASAFAGESYRCVVSHLRSGTLDVVRSETREFSFDGFLETCRTGKCQEEKVLFGHELSDRDWVSLVAHNSKPPVVAVMLVSFKKNSAGEFEYYTLSGTDFGNRLYLQVPAGDTEISVSCSFLKAK